MHNGSLMHSDKFDLVWSYNELSTHHSEEPFDIIFYNPNIICLVLTTI